MKFKALSQSGRVTHLSVISSSQRSMGVLRQLEYEVEAASILDLPWVTELWETESFSCPGFLEHRQIPRGFRGWLGMRLFHAIRLFKLLKRNQVVIVRYMPLPLFDLFALSFFQRPRVAYVLHTNYEDLLRVEAGLIGSLLAPVDRFIRNLLLRRSIQILGASESVFNCCSKEAISIGTTLYPNGVSIADFSAEGKIGDQVEVIFVASTFFPWMGLEDLLKSVGTSKVMADRPVLHLVGHCSDRQLQLIDQVNVKGLVRVLYHGRVKHKKIIELASTASIALGPLRLDLAGLKDSTSLKVREYLAMGIPVYATSKDAAIPDEFEFYTTGPLDWDKICAASHSFTGQERAVIATEAKVFISKVHLVRELNKALQSLSNL